MQKKQIKNIIKFSVIVIISIVGFLFMGEKVSAATYYMSADGSDDCLNLQECFNLMVSGDELIIRDGVYTGEDNTIFPLNYPSSGSPGTGYTIIKAEHTGKAIFDGEGIREIVNINGNGMNPQPSYIQFEGLIFRNSLGNNIGIFYSNHIKILKCGMNDAQHEDGTSASQIFFRYVDYALIEDSYAWGNGKYKYYILDSNHIILRRCIDRFDRGISTSGFHSSFRIYSSNHVELQNCIAIDAEPEYSLERLDNGSLIPAGAHFIIWSGGINGPNDDVHIKGTFVLNNQLPDGRAYILQNSYSPKNNTITNSVFWGVHNGLWTRLEISNGTVFDHLIVGNNKCGGNNNGEGIAGECCAGGSAVAKNSIFYNMSGYGIKYTSFLSDYNTFYDNIHNYGSGLSPGLHDFCSENGNEINPLDNSLKYLPRIEDGSNLDGTASDGGDRGATIIKRMGKSGTFWGEPGYNLLQDGTNGQADENLWPFPNEDIIKEHMAAYSWDDGSGGEPEITGNRGFAADGNGLYGGPITLTSYIWEYLGNPCPAEICNYSGEDTTPPIRSNPSPTGEQTAGTTNTTISLTTNETATCKYSTTTGTTYDLMTGIFINTNLTTHSTIVSGLSNGNTYHYYIRCQDESGNQNTDDFEILFSIANTTYCMSDFIQLVLDWLKNGIELTTDINNDEVVNTRDLGIMMSNWRE